MSEKIRQGNDIRISWSLVDEDEQPYNLEGRNIAIELHTGKKKVRIKEHSVSGNTVFFTYYGKDQKYIGSYNLVFIENDGQVDMVTFDTKDAFALVEHSWLAIDEGETPETIQLEFVTVTSELTERIGPPGAAAGFGTVDADVDDTLGPPSVDVETSGPNTAKNIHFSFHGLKPEMKTLAGMPLTGSGDVVKEITTDVGRQYVYFTGVQNSATVLLVNRGNILYLIKINSAGKWCTVSAFGSPSDIARAGDKVYYKLGGGLILYVGDSYSSGISFITLINHSSHEVEATTLSSLPSGYTECAIDTVASKGYVDQAVATSSATFLGTSAVGLSKAQFLAWADTLNADLNDYCYWDTVDSIGNQIYKRYKYDGSQWLFEYSISVNEFSAEQMDAINSGIDAEKVAQISKKASVAITSNAPVLQFYPNAPFTAIIGSNTGALALVEFDGTNPFVYDFRGNVIKAGKHAPTFGIELPNGNYYVAFLTGGSVSNVYADNNRYSGSELFDVVTVYSKPASGIPATDLAAAVQTSLGKADTAAQTHVLNWGSNNKITGVGDALRANAGDVVILTGDGLWDVIGVTGDGDRGLFVDSIYYDDPEDVVSVHAFGTNNIALYFTADGAGNIDTDSIHVFNLDESDLPLYLNVNRDEESDDLVISNASEAMSNASRPKFIGGSGLLELLAETIEPGTTPNNTPFPVLDISLVEIERLGEPVEYIAVTFAYTFGLEDLKCYRLFFNSSTYVYDSYESVKFSGMYQKPSGGIPASDLASGVIPAPEVFVATYGTTTAAEIAAAVTAGKIPICDYNGTRHYYVGVQTYSNVDYHYFYSTSSTNVIRYVRVKVSDNGWYASSGTLQSTSYRVSTLSGNESDTTKYPNCKAVYDAIPQISTDISADATSDIKTASPKAVKDYADSLFNGEYVTAWDGASTPVVANIPAGVSVTYNSTSYTGTLAASASTLGKIYLVSNGSGAYYRYKTGYDGSTYSWSNLGTTEISLSDYATKTEVSQLAQEVDEIVDELVQITIPQTGTTGYYIAIGDAGATVDFSSPAQSASYSSFKYYIQQVNPGDIVIVNGQGTSTARTWGILDADKKVLSRASTSDAVSNLELTVPSNGAYVVINDRTGVGTETYKYPGTLAKFNDKMETIDEYAEEVSAELVENMRNIGYKIILTPGKYPRKNGNLYDDASGFASELIPTRKGIVYKYYGATKYANPCIFVLFDKDMNVLRYENNSGGAIYSGYTIQITEENAAYIRFGAYSETELYVEPYAVCDNDKSFYGDLKNIVDELFFTTGVNLFNKDASDLLSDYYLSGTALASGSGYKVSGNIPVKSGVTYKFPFGNSLGANHTVWLANRDGTRQNNYTVTESDGFATFTAPRDGYMRVNLGKSSPETFMVCESINYPSYYVPFRQMLDEDYSLNDKQASEVKQYAIGNKLWGKIIAIDGDSIAYGAGSNGTAFGEIIAERNNMTIENKAVGGATIENGTYSSGGVAHHWICESIETLRADADYILFDGGVNDPNTNLGAITPGFAGPFDKSTYCGGFEYCCYVLNTRFAGKKIGYVFVHRMTNGFSYLGNEDTNRYWIAKKILEKWGVPYIDLNKECPPFEDFQNSGVQALEDVATAYVPDGWHPNLDGYKKYYCDKIEAWMLTL